MKTLIIHHLQKMWEPGYERFGTSFDELAKKTLTHIKRAKYDRVILTQFEAWNPAEEHIESGINNYVNQWEEYGYGWYLDDEEIKESDGKFMKDKYNNKYVNGGHHSEVVWIAEWMEKLKGDSVSICGAFDGECIEDLEIGLNACDVKFRRIEKLII